MQRVTFQFQGVRNEIQFLWFLVGMIVFVVGVAVFVGNHNMLIPSVLLSGAGLAIEIMAYEQVEKK